MTMKNIYIVGFMGTGKTVVGRALSRRLKVEFVDLDARIEEKEKETIACIFKSKGEEHFRRVEKEALSEAVANDRSVISCGGGVVLDPANISAMKKTGICVCLSASAEEILRRIGVTTHRPLLHGPNPLEKIQSLLSSRDPCYRQADILIDTTNLSVEEIVALILEKLPPAIISKK